MGTTLRNTRSRTGMCVAYAWDLGRDSTKTCFYKPSSRVSILVVPVECLGTCPRRRALVSEQQEGPVPVRGTRSSAPLHSQCSAFSSPCAAGPGSPRTPPRGAAARPGAPRPGHQVSPLRCSPEPGRSSPVGCGGGGTTPKVSCTDQVC